MFWTTSNRIPGVRQAYRAGFVAAHPEVPLTVEGLEKAEAAYERVAALPHSERRDECSALGVGFDDFTILDHWVNAYALNNVRVQEGVESSKVLALFETGFPAQLFVGTRITQDEDGTLRIHCGLKTSLGVIGAHAGLLPHEDVDGVRVGRGLVRQLRAGHVARLQGLPETPHDPGVHISDDAVGCVLDVRVNSWGPVRVHLDDPEKTDWAPLRHVDCPEMREQALARARDLVEATVPAIGFASAGMLTYKHEGKRQADQAWAVAGNKMGVTRYGLALLWLDIEAPQALLNNERPAVGVLPDGTIMDPVECFVESVTRSKDPRYANDQPGVRQRAALLTQAQAWWDSLGSDAQAESERVMTLAYEHQELFAQAGAYRARMCGMML